MANRGGRLPPLRRRGTCAQRHARWRRRQPGRLLWIVDDPNVPFDATPADGATLVFAKEQLGESPPGAVGWRDLVDARLLPGALAVR